MNAREREPDIVHSARLKICFIGAADYTTPLNPTQEKKFRLLTKRFDVVVVARSRTWQPRHFREHATFYLIPRFGPALLRQAMLLGLGSFVAAWVVSRHRIDVVVAQSPYEGAAGAIAKLFARILGRQVRLVVEAHSDFELDPFQQRVTRLKTTNQLMMRITSLFAFKHADALRSISSSTDEQLRRWAPGRPLERFPAWTDIEAFLKAGELRKASSDVLYVGTLIPRKGVHHLLRSFARVVVGRPDVTLSIVGSQINPHYATQLRQLVRELGLTEQVRFEPAVPQSQLAARMAQTAILVLPSLSEGLGRVVFEAMATGTPVVASAVGGIPDMVREGDTGWLVPPADEDALAKRLEWALCHPSEVAEVGQRARAFAERYFSADHYLVQYANLFARAMGQRPTVLNASGPSIT